MSVVDSFDWENRRIYLAADAWHPLDVYREHRAERRTNTGARRYTPLVRMEGMVPKGGGKYTPRYVVMLDGAKIVPVDGSVAPVTTITGEIITDDQTEFVDVSALSIKPLVKYQPPEAEIIEVSTGSAVTQQDKADIAAAVADLATEGSLTLRETMRLLLASLVGRVSGAPNGPIVFRGITDTKDRITATVDQHGNRLSVIYDAGEL